MCMTQLADLPLDAPVLIEPLRAFPMIRDLVTDVSWNYRVKRSIRKFQPRPPDVADGTWRMQQADIERVQEFRKCIECFLCQDVCHVLRDHHKHEEFADPRHFVYSAALEMHPLDKELHPGAVPRALERAERYRLLNEPWQAESICRDILHTDPDNQRALVTLLTALTDQFGGALRGTTKEAHALLSRITDEYERTYYGGMVSERWADAALRDGAPGGGVFDWFSDALGQFERTEALAAPANEDAVLRWNACVRVLHSHPHLQPRSEDSLDADFMDFTPSR